ncbi:MAG: hypothetical protein AMXMBFR78_11460 [Rubrivivax sp.]|jgi:hypothetical protein
MGIIEDVIKALERIPNWKRALAAPAEIDALKARVAELEARLAPASGDQCPRCRVMAYRLELSRPEPGPFGALGAMEDVYRCSSCNYENIRKRNPG